MRGGVTTNIATSASPHASSHSAPHIQTHNDTDSFSRQPCADQSSTNQRASHEPWPDEAAISQTDLEPNDHAEPYRSSHNHRFCHSIQ